MNKQNKFQLWVLLGLWLQKEFSVDAEEKHILPITWKPQKAGGFRESLLVKFDWFRCYATLLGEAFDKPEPKRKRKVGWI